MTPNEYHLDGNIDQEHEHSRSLSYAERTLDRDVIQDVEYYPFAATDWEIRLLHRYAEDGKPLWLRVWLTIRTWIANYKTDQ